MGPLLWLVLDPKTRDLVDQGLPHLNDIPCLPRPPSVRPRNQSNRESLITLSKGSTVLPTENYEVSTDGETHERTGFSHGMGSNVGKGPFRRSVFTIDVSPFRNGQTELSLVTSWWVRGLQGSLNRLWR